MSKSLKTLSRIQKFNIDEQRKILIARLRQMSQEYVEEKAFAAANPGVGDFGAYTKLYLERRRLEEAHLQRVTQEIDAIRNKIADMFREQKTYQIVDKRREAAAVHEAEQKEQKSLDEIGTNAYIKQRKNK